MRRVDGERRQDRVHRFAEGLRGEVALRRRELVPHDDADAGLLERRGELDEERGRVVHEPEHALADAREQGDRRQPVGSGGRDARLELLVHARDPDHEKLVEVRAEDGEELHALEERKPAVAGLVEDPGVELQPRELAVDEQAGLIDDVGCPAHGRRLPVRARMR